MVFDACIMQTLLYETEIWEDNISASSWNEIERKHKFLLHSGVKSTNPRTIAMPPNHVSKGRTGNWMLNIEIEM